MKNEYSDDFLSSKKSGNTKSNKKNRKFKPSLQLQNENVNHNYRPYDRRSRSDSFMNTRDIFIHTKVNAVPSRERHSLNCNISYSDGNFDLSSNYFLNYPAFLCDPYITWITAERDINGSLPFSLSFSYIVTLNLYRNMLTSFLDPQIIKAMVSLETLILRSNNLSEISEESIAALQQVNKLNHLDISENKIIVFPASLSNISSLRTLDFEHNKITYLPNEFVKFENNLEQFFCSGNSLHFPLQEMAERKGTGLQFIFRYLKKFKSGAISNSLKVIIIGNEMAGKSTFARSLRDKISFSNMGGKVRDSFDSTIGIDIHECKIEDEKRNLISLNIWDFAGQGIYHSVHEVFFTKNALYLLIWDVRYDNFDEYVYFWVALINARVPGASIFIIATHADIPSVINTTGNISMNSLDIQAHKQRVIENIDKLKEYLYNRECARMYQLKNESKNSNSIIPEGPNIIGYFFTGFTVSSCNVDDNLTCVTYGDDHFDQVVSAIKKIITSTDVCPRPLGIIGYPLVDIWIKVEDILNESRRSFRFISIQDIHSKVKERFSSFGSIELMDIVDAVDFFSMCGEVVYFTSSIELEATHDELHDLVFLSPLWLMEMIKIVLDHNIRNCFRKVNSFKRISTESDRGSFSEESSFINSRNSIFSWDVIEGWLFENKMLNNLISSNSIKLIRHLFEYYGIIIPVNQSIESSTSENSFDSPSSTNKNSNEETITRYYVLPALLIDMKEDENIHYLLPTFKDPAFSKLERQFLFSSFVPPGLIQRIMAKLYFERNVIISENAIWKNSFCQLIGKDTGNSGRRTSAAYIMVFLEKCNKSLRENADVAFKLKIIAYGQSINYKSILEHLDHYCFIVKQILDYYPGILESRLISLCPMCFVKGYDIAGEFHLENDCYVDSISSTSNKEIVPKFTLRNFNFNDFSIVFCKLRGCQVKAEHIVSGNIPSELEYSENGYINFLTDELVRLSSTNELYTIECIRNSCCRVLTGVARLDQLNTFGKVYFKPQEMASGVFVDVSSDLSEANTIHNFNPANHLKLYSKFTSFYIIWIYDDIDDSTKRNMTKFILSEIMEYPYRFSDDEKYNIAEYVWEKEEIEKVILDKYFSRKTEEEIKDYICNIKLCIMKELGLNHFYENRKASKANETYKRYEPIVLTSYHSFKPLSCVTLEERRICLIGNEKEFLCIAEIIYKGTNASDISDTSDNIKERRNSYYDVTALAHFRQIDPISVKDLNSSLQFVNVISESFETISNHFTCSLSLSNCDVTLEQPIRVIGFPEGKNLCVDWGRVVQITNENQFIAKVYGQRGSSGGPAIDVFGQVIGIVHGGSPGFLTFFDTKKLLNDLFQNDLECLVKILNEFKMDPTVPWKTRIEIEEYIINEENARIIRNYLKWKNKELYKL